MTYICKRCGYLTELKANLKKHLTKKTPCKTIGDLEQKPTDLLLDLYPSKPDNEYSCVCGKKYCYKSNLCRHQHNCEKYQQSTKLQELEKMVEVLKGEVKEAKNNTQSVTANGDHNIVNSNNVTNNNIVNHNTIIVNNFGNEDISYL